MIYTVLEEYVHLRVLQKKVRQWQGMVSFIVERQTVIFIGFAANRLRKTPPGSHSFDQGVAVKLVKFHLALWAVPFFINQCWDGPKLPPENCAWGSAASCAPMPEALS